MTIKTLCLNTLFSVWLITALSALALCAESPINAGREQPTSSVISERDGANVSGTWSGTFFSKHSNAPFSMTVVVKADSTGHLVGTATLDSDCLKEAHLQVTVSGSGVVLAGSDEAGDSITVRGAMDDTGKQLKASYILHASASGRCETDQGSGTLMKQ